MNFAKKPITIEFAGMPKAGKSTQLEIIETILKHNGYSVRIIYEGARICPLDKRDRFQYNAWSFHNTINRIMEAKINNFDYLLIDRGIYDHIAFTLALYKSGQITNKQYRAQLEYFKEFQFLEDLTLIFLINPEEAIKRENKHHNFTGRVMNKDFLSVLYEAYEKTIPEIEQKNFLIDDSKSVEENKKEILNFVIS